MNAIINILEPDVNGTLRVNNSNNNIYSSSSLHSVKYLIDINDLKHHLNSTSNLLTLKNTEMSTVSSKVNLIEPKAGRGAHEELYSSQQMRNDSKRKRKRRRGVCCCLVQVCVLLFKCSVGSIKCFTSCCVKPWCSMASVLAILAALGGVLAAVLCMGMLGVVTIPHEITRSICNATHERNNFYYQQNFTIIKEVEKNLTSFGRKCV